MKQKLRYVGLDVHVDTIAVAVAEEQGLRCGALQHDEEGREFQRRAAAKIKFWAHCGRWKAARR